MVKSLLRMIIKNRWLTITLKNCYEHILYNLPNGFTFNPLSATLILTYNCNCRCKMCFYYNENEMKNTLKIIKDNKDLLLTTDEIMDIIDQISDMGVKVLNLHGGEPFIRKDIIEIIEYAKNKNLIVTITTNGTLINANLAKKLVELDVDWLNFSIDGPKEIHNKIRGFNAYDKVIEAIGRIQKYKKVLNNDFPKLSVAVTISTENENYLYDVVKISHELGVNEVTYMLSTYYSKDAPKKTKEILNFNGPKIKEPGSPILERDMTNIQPEIILNEKKKIKEYAKKHGIRVWFPTDDCIKNYYDLTYNQLNFCIYPWRSFVISPYGYLYPCIPLAFISYSVGNVRENRMKEIWNSKEFREFRMKLKKLKLLPICSKCCMINGGELL